MRGPPPASLAQAPTHAGPASGEGASQSQRQSAAEKAMSIYQDIAFDCSRCAARRRLPLLRSRQHASAFPSRRRPPLPRLQHMRLPPPARGPASLKSTLRQRKRCLFIKTHHKGTALHRSHTSLPLSCPRQKTGGHKRSCLFIKTQLLIAHDASGIGGAARGQRLLRPGATACRCCRRAGFPEFSEAACRRKGCVYLSRHHL